MAKINKKVPTGGVTINKDYKRRMIINKIFEYILGIFVVCLIAFVGWLSIYAPVRTESGYVYTDSQPPKNGDKVIVTNASSDFAGRIVNGTFPENIRTGKVIVGNYGTLTNTGGVYTVTQEEKTFPTSVKVENKHGKYLNNEYIIECETGCKPGTQFLAKGQFVQKLK